MNAGPTSERVYLALKRHVLSLDVRPGDRLDPGLLAETLAASVTPVRDALNVLTGEGLVETRTSSGFRLPLIDAPALQDLHRWLLDVAMLSLTARRGSPPRLEPDEAGYLGRVEALFATLGAWSGNAEHGRAIAAANDRLRAARRVEADLLPVAEAGVQAVIDHLQGGDVRALRGALVRLTRQCQRAAPAVVRALYGR